MSKPRLESRNGAACRFEVAQAVELLGKALNDQARAPTMVREAQAHVKAAQRHACWWARELAPRPAGGGA